MGYNGNNRKPYNVWKPSLFKRGSKLLIPKPRKPRNNVFRQNKAAQASFTARTYKLPPLDGNTHTGKTNTQKDDATLSCIVCLLVAVAILALIGWIFGWEWSFIIPIILIIFMFIPK